MTVLPSCRNIRAERSTHEGGARRGGNGERREKCYKARSGRDYMPRGLPFMVHHHWRSEELQNAGANYSPSEIINFLP